MFIIHEDFDYKMAAPTSRFDKMVIIARLDGSETITEWSVLPFLDHYFSTFFFVFPRVAQA